MTETTARLDLARRTVGELVIQRDTLLASLRAMVSIYDGEDGNSLINPLVWAKVEQARAVLAEVDQR